jgi:hypothetical protein
MAAASVRGVQGAATREGVGLLASRLSFSMNAGWAAPAARQRKVEVAVLIIERWLLGRLRHRRF